MIRRLAEARSKIPPFSELLERAQQVGGLSLAALLVGGSILILFSINIITSDQVYRSDGGGSSNGATMVVFRYGSQLGVQMWLAVLGVAFGLLSFGMNGSFTHLFDGWSTNRINSAPGLNYARYLNTQPQSPVFLGVRGFPFAILVRNSVIALGIIASAGYSFAVVDVVVNTYQHIDQGLVNLRIPPSEALLKAGTTSPWFGDAPLSSQNRAFVHQLDYRHYWGKTGKLGPRTVPKRIVMTGWADCGKAFNVIDKGLLYTRELVLIARKVQDTEPHLDIFMTAEVTDWLRVENATSRWIDTGDGTDRGQAVVDYRTPRPGRIEVQWAEIGTWVRNGSEKQPVVRKVAFEIRLGVAIVERLVSGRDCSKLSDEDGTSLSVQIFTTSKTSVIGDNYQEAPHLSRNWISSIILSNNAGPREGVSGLVRGVMATWAANSLFHDGENLSSYLGHAPAIMPPNPQPVNTSNQGSGWFDEKAYNKSARHFPLFSLLDSPEALNNSASESARRYNLSAEYPTYAGTRTTGQTGSYHIIIYLFIFFGVFAYFLVGLRMYLGPAELTSWMGQHVYLAGLGAKIPKEATDHLASGYQAAMQSELGRLRIKADEPFPKPRFGSRVPYLAGEDGLYWGRWVNGL